jgi:hypothetical protein
MASTTSDTRHFLLPWIKTDLSFLVFRVMIPLLLWAALDKIEAQSLTNGDLSKGNTGWKGDRIVVADPDKTENRVLAIETSKFSYKYFSQQIDTGRGNAMTVSFDVKISSDYQGGEFRIQVNRPDGSNFYRDYTAAPGSWQPMVFNYTEVNGARKLDLLFRVSPGLGKIYFDNFKVTK